MTKRAYLGIDHVVIRTADAASLHALFSDTLGLPVTWPLAHAAFATFGWIGLGNANLEIWAAADNSDLPLDCPFPLVHQIALAPFELSKTLARFKALGLTCKAPRTYASKNEHGQELVNFTNSVIQDLSSDSCCVFVCDWGINAPIVPWENGLSTRQRRYLERQALDACAGGPLGLIGLKEIAMSSRDFERAANSWFKLVGSKADHISIAAGVGLRLTAGTIDIIQSMTFAVRDLGEARRFLHSRGLLDEDETDGVILSRRATTGLKFRLVEAMAARG